MAGWGWDRVSAGRKPGSKSRRKAPLIPARAHRQRVRYSVSLRGAISDTLGDADRNRLSGRTCGSRSLLPTGISVT
jgi:hypothetical protein